MYSPFLISALLKFLGIWLMKTKLFLGKKDKLICGIIYTTFNDFYKFIFAAIVVIDHQLMRTKVISIFDTCGDLQGHNINNQVNIFQFVGYIYVIHMLAPKLVK